MKEVCFRGYITKQKVENHCSLFNGDAPGTTTGAARGGNDFNTVDMSHSYGVSEDNFHERN